MSIGAQGAFFCCRNIIFKGDLFNYFSVGKHQRGLGPTSSVLGQGTNQAVTGLLHFFASENYIFAVSKNSSGQPIAMNVL